MLILTMSLINWSWNNIVTYVSQVSLFCLRINMAGFLLFVFSNLLSLLDKSKLMSLCKIYIFGTIV